LHWPAIQSALHRLEYQRFCGAIAIAHLLAQFVDLLS
jgi:hypothetical protein